MVITRDRVFYSTLARIINAEFECVIEKYVLVITGLLGDVKW